MCFFRSLECLLPRSFGLPYIPRRPNSSYFWFICPALSCAAPLTRLCASVTLTQECRSVKAFGLVPHFTTYVRVSFLDMRPSPRSSKMDPTYEYAPGPNMETYIEQRPLGLS